MKISKGELAAETALSIHPVAYNERDIAIRLWRVRISSIQLQALMTEC
jgi:hypothetical protein